MLNFDDISPLYEQLMDKIQSDIKQGIYKQGTQMPTEMKLCSSYGVSRATVRNALSKLEEKGLIVRKQGKGTFVYEDKMVRNISINASFTDVCIANGKKPGGKVLKCMLQKASEEDIRELKLQEGDLIIAIDRIRYANDEAVSFESSHFPERFSYLLDIDLKDKSLFQVMKEKFDVVFYPGYKTIEQAYAGKEIAQYLGVKIGHPLIEIRAVSTDSNETPIHFSCQKMLGDKLKFYV